MSDQNEALQLAAQYYPVNKKTRVIITQAAAVCFFVLREQGPIFPWTEDIDITKDWFDPIQLPVDHPAGDWALGFDAKHNVLAARKATTL